MSTTNRKAAITLVVLFMTAVLVAGCDSPASPGQSTPVPAGATTAATSAPATAPAAGATGVPTGNATGGAQYGGVQVSTEAKDTVIQLRWNAVANAAGYQVFRDGGAKPLNAKPLTATSYDDIGLSNGRAYRYSVVVVDGGGQVLARSAEITATPKGQ